MECDLSEDDIVSHANKAARVSSLVRILDSLKIQRSDSESQIINMKIDTSLVPEGRVSSI